MDPTGTSKICVDVAVRIRPLLGDEVKLGSCLRVFLSLSSANRSVVEIHDERGNTDNHDDDNTKIKNAFGKLHLVRMKRNNPFLHCLEFDEVFPMDSSQDYVYRKLVEPLVESALTTPPHATCTKMQCHTVNILTYGKADSGKTYTIIGHLLENKDSPFDEETAGIIPRAFQHAFVALGQQKVGDPQTLKVKVEIQLLEIYGEELYDLMMPVESAPKSPRKQTDHQIPRDDVRRVIIRDSNTDHKYDPELVGVSRIVVATAEEAMQYFVTGMSRRSMGRTALKNSTCRSHVVLTIIVNRYHKRQPNTIESSSKLNFIDLAGSERIDRTHTVGTRLHEGISINKSLLVLGNVLSILNQSRKKGSHSNFAPFRDSKLTHMLRGSLSGKANKTLLIACVSPAAKDAYESLDCLQLANRVRNELSVSSASCDGNFESETSDMQMNYLDTSDLKVQTNILDARSSLSSSESLTSLESLDTSHWNMEEIAHQLSESINNGMQISPLRIEETNDDTIRSVHTENNSRSFFIQTTTENTSLKVQLSVWVKKKPQDTMIPLFEKSITSSCLTRFSSMLDLYLYLFECPKFRLRYYRGCFRRPIWSFTKGKSSFDQ
jgi:Kinesin motor domain